MADKSFWRDVRVQVVASLIVAILVTKGGEALGWWPATGIARAWGVLTKTTPLPLWALLLVTAAFAVLIRLLLMQRAALSDHAAGARQSPPPPPKRFEPDELQVRALRELAAADGEAFPPEYLQMRLNAGNLLLDKALRGLEQQGLIAWREGYGSRPHVRLTTIGSDYVIAAGYAPSQPRRG